MKIVDESILFFSKVSLWKLSTFRGYKGIYSRVYIDNVEIIISKSHSPRALKIAPTQQKEKPNREHRCGAGQIPSEDQVRTILTTLEC